MIPTYTAPTAVDGFERVAVLREAGACGLVRVPHWSGPLCWLLVTETGELRLVDLEQPGDG
jgi:hypothetical protein